MPHRALLLVIILSATTTTSGEDECLTVSSLYGIAEFTGVYVAWENKEKNQTILSLVDLKTNKSQSVINGTKWQSAVDMVRMGGHIYLAVCNPCIEDVKSPYHGNYSILRFNVTNRWNTDEECEECGLVLRW